MQQIKRLLTPLLGSDAMWPFFQKTLVWAADVVKGARMRVLERRHMELMASRVSPGLVVLRGVFAGLKYSQAIACGSTLTPKLLGCYEAELAGVIEQICDLPIKHVYDIGCAEGYYAVGLAMRMKNVRVHAFDTDEEARHACMKLAEANLVSERVLVAGATVRDDLLNWENGSLILSDCEGYESELFDQAIAARHSDSWFLIEVHDTVDPELSTRLRRVFEKTHVINVITSLDDLKKADSYVLPELDGMPRGERFLYVKEDRPRLMDWFWCTPLHTQP
jgi:hypothetical protein